MVSTIHVHRHTSTSNRLSIPPNPTRCRWSSCSSVTGSSGPRDGLLRPFNRPTHEQSLPSGSYPRRSVSPPLSHDTRSSDGTAHLVPTGLANAYLGTSVRVERVDLNGEDEIVVICRRG